MAEVSSTVAPIAQAVRIDLSRRRRSLLHRLRRTISGSIFHEPDEAILSLFNGGNTGKLIVKVGDRMMITGAGKSKL